MLSPATPFDCASCMRSFSSDSVAKKREFPRRYAARSDVESCRGITVDARRRAAGVTAVAVDPLMDGTTFGPALWLASKWVGAWDSF